MTAVIRVGLVGAGYVSEFHIAALKRDPRVRIAGITDLDPARAKATAERFGIAAFPSLKVMAVEGLDVVHVLTPPATHVAVALEALALSCHVLIEKPLATSVEDCDRLIAEARQRKLSACVNHSLLGDPVIRRALALARSGAIGDVLGVDILRSSNYPPYRGGPLPPQYREGGYPFRDLGVHALYLLQAFLGDIVDVQASFRDAAASSTANSTNYADPENKSVLSAPSVVKPFHKSDPNLLYDEWRALVRCARATANVYLSWNVKPLQHVILVHGTRGTLRADLFTMCLTRRRNTPLPKAIERVANALGESVSAAGQVVASAALFVAGRIRPYQGLHNFAHSFYDALAAGGPMPVDLNQAREVVRWTEQVAREADDTKEKFFRGYRATGKPATVVTGANGLLGRALVNRLLKQGERIRLFVRRLPAQEILDHPKVEVVLGELGDSAAVDAALKGATTVFHLGAAMSGGWAAHEAATITGTRNVVEACLKQNVEKLVYISSLSVLDWAGHPVDHPVTESSPLEPSPQARGYYTQAKLEAERIVRAAVEEHKLRAVILRPGQIWSESSPLLTPAVGIRLGNHLITFGDQDARLPLVHADDVVAALLLALTGKFTNGEVFHIVDKDLMSRSELVRLYILGREPELKDLHVSLKVMCWLARGVELLGKLLHRPVPISPYRLRSAVAPLTFDCTKAREQLGWRPEVSTSKQLRAVLARNIR